MLGLSPLHPSGADQKVYIPEGYHNGNGYVKINSVYGLSEKTITIPEGYHNGSGYVLVKALSGDIDVTNDCTWSMFITDTITYTEHY